MTLDAEHMVKKKKINKRSIQSLQRFIACVRNFYWHRTGRIALLLNNCAWSSWMQASLPQTARHQHVSKKSSMKSHIFSFSSICLELLATQEVASYNQEEKKTVVAICLKPCQKEAADEIDLSALKTRLLIKSNVNIFRPAR